MKSLVPARMDRLPWSIFHWRMIIALGITWILDGVEIGLAGAIGDVLRQKETLHLDAQTVALSGSLYLIGEVVGALYFGHQADRLGRRRLFIVTLALYLAANAISALSFSTWFFLATRLIAGMGIGGEYAAIHSAIDELTPARYRGRVDIAIAGTYWAGAMLAACAQIALLDPHLLPIDIGWRVSLLIGPVIGILIWPLRRYIPESPRWLLSHGRAAEAEKTVDDIEAQITARGIALPEVDAAHAIDVTERPHIGYRAILRLLAGKYRSRSVLGLGLMITQSFLYNAIFFTYVLILDDFYHVEHTSLGYYIFPFAAGNLLGPLLLGKLFDTVGRRRMIALTYTLSGILLAVSGALFYQGVLTATTQTALWCVIFFIASAAASSAYLTVSEIFPVEIRAHAISIVFAIAQVCGAAGPSIFGAIIARSIDPTTHAILGRGALALGYAGSALVMMGGGWIVWQFGVDAEQRSLEQIAPPLGTEA